MADVPPASRARPPVTTALVLGGAGHKLAELIRPAVDNVEVRRLADVLDGDGAGANLIVLPTLAAVRELAALAALPAPRPPVLVVTPAIGPGDVLTVLRSGVRSILIEGQYTLADLLDAVRATAAGHSRLSSGPLAAVIDHVQTGPAGSWPPPTRQLLTRRELDIMELLAAGEANAAIARRLALAEKTVRNRVSQIYLKLKVNNRDEAMLWWAGRAGAG
ncbi:LuxR C-terminal-related transcriptional regulator [Dactylosporangium darangshiense]|uniref:HTH luxR-type domain-containing protein n=1 Tax=Dactylosporangium darangshiense TaxID=579108 RepID=A0ABP8DTJ9_9ACTN